MPIQQKDTYRQEAWQQIAKALLGDEAGIRSDREVMGERFPVWLQYWLVVRAFSHGDQELAMLEWKRIPDVKGWYGGLEASMLSRVKELEDENRRLRKMYADAQLSSELLKEALAKKW
jgi:hypothetical protein